MILETVNGVNLVLRFGEIAQRFARFQWTEAGRPDTETFCQKIRRGQIRGAFSVMPVADDDVRRNQVNRACCADAGGFPF